MARPRMNLNNPVGFFSTVLLVLLAIIVTWPLSFFSGQALRNFFTPADGVDSLLGSIMNVDVDWRARQAAQHLKTFFSNDAKVIDILDAVSKDLGPLSIDSIKKNNLSSSWTTVGNDNSDDTFSEVVQDTPVMKKERQTNERDQILGVDHEDTGDLPDMEKEKQTNEQDQLLGDDLEDTGDSPEMHTRRKQRVKRREERAAELIKEDVKVIEKLEDSAIHRSKSFVATALGKYNSELDDEKADSTSRLVRDQMIMARAYTSIAKMKNRTDFYEELQQKIEERERAVEKAASHAQLRQSASEKIKAMGEVLLKAREHLYGCRLVITKLRSMIQSLDDQVKSSKQESIFLTQVAAKAMPGGIHCLTMKLTIDYYLLPQEERKFRWNLNLENPDLYHYALFSDNVLAASVVVNSTIQHAKEPKKHVFHLVTDNLNFGAMNMWFLLNPPGKATIHVENIDSFKWLNSSYCPVLRQQKSAAMKEYYLKADHPTTMGVGQSNFNFKNPKYLSMMNHLRFYLPQIYPALDKILFLDDDVIVQKDLTELWSVDLRGKVNGAVETCGKSFHRFDKYLNFSNPQIAQNFDPKACGWAYGMNIFDLKQWKKRNITGIYHKWQNMNEDRTIWQLGTLPPGLIAFYRLTHPLDKSWHVLALGYNSGIDTLDIENAAVIHFNGHLKPWLEVAIDNYSSYWTRYIKYNHPYLRDCKLTE